MPPSPTISVGPHIRLHPPQQPDAKLLEHKAIVLTHLHICSRQHESSFFFLFFRAPHPQHIEVTRLRVELELQLPAYA